MIRIVRAENSSQESKSWCYFPQHVTSIYSGKEPHCADVLTSIYFSEFLILHSGGRRMKGKIAYQTTLVALSLLPCQNYS